MSKWIVMGLIIVAIVALAFVIAASLFPPFREISRDIAIVIVAVFQIVSTILTIVLLIAILYTVKSMHRLVRDTAIVKVNEILDNSRAITHNVRESADTVTTTTAFIAEQAVSPIIRVSSLMTGVKVAASVLARRKAESEHQQPISSTLPSDN